MQSRQIRKDNIRLVDVHVVWVRAGTHKVVVGFWFGTFAHVEPMNFGNQVENLYSFRKPLPVPPFTEGGIWFR